MARSRRCQQLSTPGILGLVVVLLLTACETSMVQPAAPSSAHAQQLQSELLRLATRVAALESQILVERQNAARVQQDSARQLARIAALEAQTSNVSAVTDAGSRSLGTPGSSAEAELRMTMQLLMRAIERLDISADEKAMLKSSLRPTRTIDRENPWSMARY